ITCGWRLRAVVFSAVSRRLLACGCLALLALAAAGPAAAKGAPYSRSTILVKFRTPRAAEAIAGRLGDRVLGTTLTGVAVVGLGRKDEVKRKVRQYAALPAVLYAEPNFRARGALAAPNDSSYGAQWAFPTIRAVEGWSLAPGSYSARDGVKIAIADTGV